MHTPHTPPNTPRTPRDGEVGSCSSARVCTPPQVFHCLNIPPGTDPDRVVYIGGVHDGVPAWLQSRACPDYASPFRDPNVDPAEARAQYASYLRDCPALLRAARRDLAGMHLACWCAPEPCHGDVLLAACLPRRSALLVGVRARRAEHPLARRPVGYRPPSQ